MWRALFWALVAATTAIYLVMVAWSLPLITVEAGGLTPFDLRLTGYSHDEAVAFLAALSGEGSAFYRDVQHRLDIFFPGLLAATLYFSIVWLLPARLGRLRYAVAAPVMLTAIFDWSENAAVSELLSAGPAGASPQMVEAASLRTQLKSVASTIAYSALLLLLLQAGWRRWRSRAGS